MAADKHREERLQIMLTSEELAALDDFRFKQRMPSRAAAVRELFRLGLALLGIETAAPGRNQPVLGYGPSKKERQRFRRGPMTIRKPQHLNEGEPPPRDTACEVWCEIQGAYTACLTTAFGGTVRGMASEKPNPLPCGSSAGASMRLAINRPCPDLGRVEN